MHPGLDYSYSSESDPDVIVPALQPYLYVSNPDLFYLEGVECGSFYGLHHNSEPDSIQIYI